jgi:hypothetical protein
MTMTTSRPTTPPPQRRRALAELDAVIEQAERTRARCRLDLGDAVAGARPPGRAGAMLRLAEERLEQLLRSRQVLLEGEGDRKAS